jgi:DNA-directed RNA polymerase subunit RPC12/RpoP
MTPHEAFEHHEHREPSGTCRVCSSPYSHEDNPSRFGICEKCGYKILIVLLIVMVALSYIAWFGIL